MADPQKPMTRDEMLADLDIQLKMAQLQDAQESLAMRSAQRATQLRRRKDNAKELADGEARRRARVLACPHKKGGMDLEGWRHGTSDKYAKLVFQLPNGDHMISCSRCGNVLLPPVEPLKVDLATLGDLEQYGFQSPAQAGFFDRSDTKGFAAAMKIFRAGVKTYNIWLAFPTDNVASTACLPGQIAGDFDWKRFYRIAAHECQGIPLYQAEKWAEGPAAVAAA